MRSYPAPTGQFPVQATRDGGQRRAHVAGLEADLSVGEAERCEPGRGVRLVAHAVPRLLCGRAVVAQPVGFDDEAELGPVEVHVEAVQAAPGLRFREPGPADQWEEAALELGVRQ